MKKFLIFSIAFLFLTGCSNIKIPNHNLTQLDHLNEIIIKNQIDQYNNAVIQKANIINSIVFKFRGKNMAAIGMTKLDSKNKNFSVAGFSPMGLTLFKLKIKGDKLISSYVIPEFGSNNLKKAADMISKDIARIYFDRKINIQKSLFLIDQCSVTTDIIRNNKRFEYIFTGKPLKLTTKIMYKNKKKIWSVDYYDYKSVKNLQIPFRIFLKHYQYNYSLNIETKKIKLN